MNTGMKSLNLLNHFDYSAKQSKAKQCSLSILMKPREQLELFVCWDGLDRVNCRSICAFFVCKEREEPFIVLFWVNELQSVFLCWLWLCDWDSTCSFLFLPLFTNLCVIFQTLK